MSGIPVDVLVDIDGSINSFSQLVNLKDFNAPDFDDDPFEICSKQQNIFEKDLGIQLGLALEKSIKLHSQTSEKLQEPNSTIESNQTNLGILINFDESPDKKPSCSKQVIPLGIAEAKETNSVFDSPANPFQLAWDVIQQEALSLADQILHEKENPISPRKMVDLAMKLSPESLLMSPHHGKRDEEILINSSPELEMKKTPKLHKAPQYRTRPSIGGSPLIAKNYATPLRSQPRMSINPSPSTKISKFTSQSPSTKNPSHRGVPLKPPLLRSSSAMAPLARPPLSKTLSAKVAPVKAAHPSNNPPGTASKLNFRGVPQNSMQQATPLRRPASTSETPSEIRLPSLNLASKLRAASSRSDQDALQQGMNKAFENQRNSSARLQLKRTTGVSQQNNSIAAKTHLTTRTNPGSLRSKPKGRESIAHP